MFWIFIIWTFEEGSFFIEQIDYDADEFIDLIDKLLVEKSKIEETNEDKD